MLPAKYKTTLDCCVIRTQVLDRFSTRKLGEDLYLPKTMIENPMTKTRFNTFPTAWVSGATLSRVLVAICKPKRKELSKFQMNPTMWELRKRKIPDCTSGKTFPPRKDRSGILSYRL